MIKPQWLVDIITTELSWLVQFTWHSVAAIHSVTELIDSL